MATGAGSALTAIVVTDLVSSTAQRTALGEAAADDLVQSVHRISAQQIEAHAGTVIKGMGDGVLATFSGAADAVAAAVAVQQSVTKQHEVQLRVGLSVGDVNHADGDVLGLPVIEASRLCSAAESGQILVADVVRVLAHGRAGDVFRSVGSLELKGLANPLVACAVEWEPLAEARLPRPPFPAALLDPGGIVFVGRSRDLGAIRRAWRQAEDGGSRSMFIVGQAGMGKTRLIGESVRVMAADGAIVLLGRCRRDAGVAYQPFAEALRTALEGWRGADLDAAAGSLAADLVRLVPSIAGRMEQLAASTGATNADRQRLFEAVRLVLAALAHENSAVVMVIDDLHWADHPTLQLLRYLVAAHVPRLAIFGTYRDPDETPSPVLATHRSEMLAAGGDELHLSGLDLDDIVRLQEFAIGRALEQFEVDNSEVIRAITGGNPLFLSIGIRLLRQHGLVIDDGTTLRTLRVITSDDVPDSILAAIDARLEGLSDDSRRILSAAAVCGREFDPEIVAAICDVSPRRVLDAVADLERLRLVAASSETPGRFTFLHDLVCAALDLSLVAADREELHRAAAGALEQRSASSTELAQHLLAAGDSRAVEASRAAANAAMAGTAYETAVNWLERALELVPAGTPEHAEVTSELALARAAVVDADG